MGAPSIQKLGWEDIGKESAISVFGEWANPYDDGASRRGPRARLIAMARMGMASEQCELCRSSERIAGEKIDPSGPEDPENYVALCPQCARAWKHRVGAQKGTVRHGASHLGIRG